MFGYFKLDRECPRAIVKHYRKNYCFLCRALQRHYGLLSRFTLSYDIAFLLILVSEDAYLRSACKVSCFNREENLDAALRQTLARDIGAANLLLCAAKLEDDIEDENSLTSRLLSLLLHRPIRKAKRNCSQMWQIISDRYRQLRLQERENAPLETLEETFASLMVDVAKECFAVEDASRLQALEAASKWLYFIDAVDDLDENLAQGSFNPLAEYGSFSNMKEHHYRELASHYRQLFRQTGGYVANGDNDKAIRRILLYGIPDTTVGILTKMR